jgi:site-specific DNA-methyltransferase (adenine-specific)
LTPPKERLVADGQIAPSGPLPVEYKRTSPASPYYENDLVTLYLGDCLDVLPFLADVDLVFTSAPYNLGINPGGVFGHWKDGDKSGGHDAWVTADGAPVIDYADHPDDMPYEDYRVWQRAVLLACWSTLSPSGAIFYNHKQRVQRNGVLLPLDLVGPYLPVRQIVTWDRGGGFNHTKTAYTPQSEWIIVIAPDGFRLAKQGAAGDVWRIPPDSGNPHPAPFPVALPAKAIETTDPQLVLDPFAGSGSTLLAATAAGVRSIGIERSERYCEMTATRLDRAQGVLL